MTKTKKGRGWATRLAAVFGASALAFAVIAAPAAAGLQPASAKSFSPEAIFNTTPQESEYFDLTAKTRPGSITVPLPKKWKNRAVTVHWLWTGKREVGVNSLRWTETHPNVEDLPNTPGYGLLRGSFKASLDASPALNIAVPYRSMIDLCWGVDIVIVDNKGKVLRKYVVPYSGAYAADKANSLVDVAVRTK